MVAVASGVEDVHPPAVLALLELLQRGQHRRDAGAAGDAQQVVLGARRGDVVTLGGAQVQDVARLGAPDQRC